jgi:hypothetical protein
MKPNEIRKKRRGRGPVSFRFYLRLTYFAGRKVMTRSIMWLSDVAERL